MQDRRAFVRDAVAHVLSTLALLGLMLRGTFSAWEAGLMLLGYCAYLAVCLLTSRRGAVGPRHSYYAVSPAQQQQQKQRELEQQQLHLELEQQQQQEGVTPTYAGSTQLSGVVVAAASEASPLHSPRLQIELVSRVGGPQPLRKLSRGVADSIGGGSSRPASPLRGRQQADGAGQETELAGLVGGMPLSDAPRSGSGGMRAAPSRGRLGSSGGLGGMLRTASLGLEELLHTKGKTGPRLWASLMMAPLTLLLHATMPALHAGGWAGRAWPTAAVPAALSCPHGCACSFEPTATISCTTRLLLCRLLHATLRCGIGPRGPLVHAGQLRTVP